MQVKANRVYYATVFPKDDYYKFSFHYIVSVAGSGLENSSLVLECEEIWTNSTTYKAG